MSKTITIRIDNPTYKTIKAAAESERRTISNFIEYASLAYIQQSSFVDPEEMRAIEEDKALIQTLTRSIQDIKRGKYRIVD